MLAQIDYYISVNAALNVDLTEQINAESINNKTIAGVGGQMDFIRGTQYSKGGNSIIAMPST
ncbi:acetyl-CoA hydrolase/transferase C-terminal domain-containing protein [Neobacillus niacini]|uniref:acetyl-CoA hydrolase/transferase C-terminal domain-containing protein n=1 Tax=Neobacillus niacini TaxID=86668 RepID=UPI00358FF42E